MVSLKRVFSQFLYIGATAFGGPLALIGLMEERLVEKKKMVSDEQFSEAVALGQTLPGPVAVDAATHIGYCLRGFLGAVSATLGIILPAFLIMLVLAPAYLKLGGLPQVEAFFQGARAAVVAIILAVCWRMGKKSLKSVPMCMIAAAVFFVTVLCRLGPPAEAIGPAIPVEAGSVILAGVLGVWLCRAGGEGKP